MKKKIVWIISYLFPTYFSKIAYQQLTQTQVKKLRPHEMEVMATATQEDFSFEDFTIKTYYWKGDTERRIMLMHGWEGQAGNFADFIPELQKEGFT